MASPFDRLTETDKLRSSIRVRDYENELAASNAAIFAEEAKMLELDTVRRQNEETKLRREASEAFATNVLSKAQTPEDLDQMGRDFISSNPRYAAYAPEAFKTGQEMFQSSYSAKERAISLAEAQRKEKASKELEFLAVQAKKAELTGTIFEQNQKMVDAKKKLLQEEKDKKKRITEWVDPDDENTLNFAKAGLKAMDLAVTDQEKDDISNKYGAVLSSVGEFRQTQNTLANMTASQFDEEMSQLKQDPEVVSAYQKWYGQNAESVKDLSDGGAFARFIGDQALSSEDPSSLGFKISSKGSNYANLIRRASVMGQARLRFNDFITKTKLDQNAPDLAEAEVRSEGLRKSVAEMKSAIEQEKTLYKDELEIRRKESQIKVNEARASDATEVARRREGIVSRMAGLQRERRRALMESNDSKKSAAERRAAEQNMDTIDNELEQLDRELNSYQQAQSSGNIEAPE